MKEIGVVRKIDELGRVVIPKEIRRTLGIKDGESLEILIEDNNICLKKYSSMYPLKKWAQFVVDICKRELGFNLIMMDMSEVIASFDLSLLGNSYPKFLENLLHLREKYLSVNAEELFNGCNGYYYFVPLILNGELLGSLLLFSDLVINEDMQRFIIFISQILVNDIT